MNEIPPGTVCANCGDREATIQWVGDGGVLAHAHGMWKPWCRLCMLRAQLDHARHMADQVPVLEAKIAEEVPDER